MSRVSAILICITAFSFQLASLTAQTAEIQYADQLFLQQQTNAALKEYLRAYYLDKTTPTPKFVARLPVVFC